MYDRETEQTIDVVQRFNDAFNEHDVDAVMALMTDDCQFESTAPPDGDRVVGQAEVRAFWQEFFTSTPTARFEGEDVIGAGDRCIVRWRYTWEADGEQHHLRGVDVMRVRDGKVAEKFAYVKG